MSTVVKRRGAAENAEPAEKNTRSRSDAGKAWGLVTPAPVSYTHLTLPTNREV